MASARVFHCSTLHESVFESEPRLRKGNKHGSACIPLKINLSFSFQTPFLTRIINCQYPLDSIYVDTIQSRSFKIPDP